jgi:hypothetical protein
MKFDGISSAFFPFLFYMPRGFYVISNEASRLLS